MQSDIEKLVKLIGRLPGLGPRSSRRLVLELIRKRESLMQPLVHAMQQVDKTIKTCANCGNIDSFDPCSICISEKRDISIICVLEDVADLWAMERSAMFKGLYHVLGGTLSAIDGIGPDALNINSLINRASSDDVTEIILATNATMDGQTTAHYLTDRLADCNVKITRLAQGIPIGGELDYLDDGTLGTALKARQVFG